MPWCITKYVIQCAVEFFILASNDTVMRTRTVCDHHSHEENECNWACARGKRDSFEIVRLRKRAYYRISIMTFSVMVVEFNGTTSNGHDEENLSTQKIDRVSAALFVVHVVLWMCLCVHTNIPAIDPLFRVHYFNAAAPFTSTHILLKHKKKQKPVRDSL